MRGTGRVILGIFGVCALVMVYVHLQVSTFLASYEIDRASVKIYSYNEQLQKLKFELEQFKAPHLLEGRLRQYEMNLDIPKMVYRVPQSFDEIHKASMNLPTTGDARTPQLLRQIFNSWIQVAHAKNETPEA